MKLPEIFHKKEEKISRKPCEDFVDSVATQLSAMGVPVTAYKENMFPRGDYDYSYRAKSAEDIPELSGKIELQASTMSVSDDDHFFAYHVHFKGCTAIEKELQEMALDYVFGAISKSARFPYERDECLFKEFYRLNALRLMHPDEVAQNIYNTVKKYTSMQKQVSCLIEKLQATERERSEILTKFEEIRESIK